jgi:hypothetical protein
MAQLPLKTTLNLSGCANRGLMAQQKKPSEPGRSATP